MRLLAGAALLGLWQLAAAAAANPSFIPAPGAVWEQFLRLSTTHDSIRGYSGSLLVEHLGISLRRILIGSVIGVAGGLVVGVVLGTVPWIRVVAEPVVTFLRALPPLAYFFLLVIWFGIDEAPKLCLLAHRGAAARRGGHRRRRAGAPADLVEAARALGASRRDVIRRRGAAQRAAGDLHRRTAGRRHRVLVRGRRRDWSTACPASAAWSGTPSVTCKPTSWCWGCWPSACPACSSTACSGSPSAG